MSPMETLYNRISDGPRRMLETRKRRKQLRPPPVARRERTLSIDNVMDTKIPFHSQIDCLLFRLPFELRLDIYELVIGTEDVHVLLRNDKIFSYRNAKPNQLLHTHNREALKPWKRSLHDRAHPREELPGLGVLSLLQTCRRIYTEMVPVLYKLPTFTFHNWSSLFAFYGAVLPDSFNMIISVSIDASYSVIRNSSIGEYALMPLNFHAKWVARKRLHVRNQLPRFTLADDPTAWTAVCTILARMNGLKNLKIDLALDCFGNPQFNDDAVLKPLVDISRRRALRSFVVKVDWESWEDRSPSEPFPFELTRALRPLQD